MCVLAIAATALHLAGSFEPGGLLSLLSRFAIFAVIIACFSNWVLALVVVDYSIRLVAKLVAPRDAPAPPVSRRAWLVLPVCVLLWGIEAFTHWPLRLRFVLAQSEFEREAHGLLRKTPVGGGDIQRVELNRRVGSFHVQFAYVDLVRGTVDFRIANWIVIAGLQYDPSESRDYWQSTCQLDDDWHAYSYLYDK